MALPQLRSGTRTAAAAAAPLMLMAVTACGDDGDSASGAGGRETVTVAALPLIDDAALYIARDRGLFEEEGLDVRIQQIQQSLQALPALAKGQIDMVASANYVTYLQAHEKGTRRGGAHGGFGGFGDSGDMKLEKSARVEVNAARSVENSRIHP